MPIKVKLSSQPMIQVRTRIAVPESISGITDVDIDNIKDGYVLMYDDNLKRYAFVDPDQLLSKSVADNFLPPEFINQLDVDLDNRVGLDGGSF
jgi:hypothetical protein